MSGDLPAPPRSLVATCAPPCGGAEGFRPPVRRGGVASPRPHRTPLLLPRRPAPPTLSQDSVRSDQQLGDEPCDGRSESGRGGSAVVLLCLGESGEKILRHRKTERSTVHCFTSMTSLLAVVGQGFPQAVDNLAVDKPVDNFAVDKPVDNSHRTRVPEKTGLHHYG